MPFQNKPVQDFMGSGITFPIELNNGKAIIKSGFELIHSSIRIILSWPVGHRYYLTEFGSRLEELLEEPNDDVLKQIIYTFVIDPITTWESRISLLDASIVDISPTAVSISLRYIIRNSKAEDSFIFPFYRKIVY